MLAHLSLIREERILRLEFCALFRPVTSFLAVSAHRWFLRRFMRGSAGLRATFMRHVNVPAIDRFSTSVNRFPAIENRVKRITVMTWLVFAVQVVHVTPPVEAAEAPAVSGAPIELPPIMVEETVSSV